MSVLRWSAYALIALMAADYVTGVMCAIADRTLSSAVGFRACQKVLIFVQVGVGHIVTPTVRQRQRVAHAVLFFNCSNEAFDAGKRRALGMRFRRSSGCDRTATLEDGDDDISENVTWGP
jgi:phage-related holin